MGFPSHTHPTQTSSLHTSMTRGSLLPWHQQLCQGESSSCESESPSLASPLRVTTTPPPPNPRLSPAMLTWNCL